MVDVFVLFVLFVVCIGGFSRGAVRQLWSLVVLVLTTFITGKIYLNFTGLTGLVVRDQIGSTLLAFVITFVLIGAILNGPAGAIIQRFREKGDLGGSSSDRLAAAIVGIIAGIGLIEVASVLLVTYPVWGLNRWVESSALIQTYISHWPFMLPLLPPEFRHAIEILT